MKIYIGFNTDGYAEQFSSTPLAGHIPMEIAENHPYFNGPWGAYYRKNNDLVIDPAKAAAMQAARDAQQNPEQVMKEQISGLQQLFEKLVGNDPARQKVVIEQMSKAITASVQNVSEEKALEMPDLFPEWAPNKNYAVGETLKYPDGNGVALFKILQAHTSQRGWKPDMNPALYKRISFAAGGVPNWVQPVGAVDAYKLNDIVVHKGQQWKSTAANNVWEPGVYGWTALGAAPAK